LKADYLTRVTGVATVSVPGVANWKGVLAVLEQLGAKSVRLAYDCWDVRDKPPVRRQFAELYRHLHNRGYLVSLEVWDRHEYRDFKGLDDLYAAGHKPTLLDPAGAATWFLALLEQTEHETAALAYGQRLNGNGATYTAAELLKMDLPDPVFILP